jgi:ABC-type multidrug transport system fused ATPase/permease subunit
VVNDPKKQAGLFRSKIGQYDSPKILSYLGILFSGIKGAVMPVFGAVMMKATFAMLFATPGMAVSATMNKWVLGLFILALMTCCSLFLKTYLLNFTSENVTENMRKDVY